MPAPLVFLSRPEIVPLTLRQVYTASDRPLPQNGSDQKAFADQKLIACGHCDRVVLVMPEQRAHHGSSGSGSFGEYTIQIRQYSVAQLDVFSANLFRAAVKRPGL